jgi:hypothetical protein
LLLDSYNHPCGLCGHEEHYTNLLLTPICTDVNHINLSPPPCDIFITHLILAVGISWISSAFGHLEDMIPDIYALWVIPHHNYLRTTHENVEEDAKNLYECTITRLAKTHRRIRYFKLSGMAWRVVRGVSGGVTLQALDEAEDVAERPPCFYSPRPLPWANCGDCSKRFLLEGETLKERVETLTTHPS